MELESKRMNCMNVIGGRIDGERHYEMPRLQVSTSSRKSCHGIHGGGEVHFVSSCASGRITRLMLADISGSEQTFKRLSGEMELALMRSINTVRQDRLIDEMSDQLQRFGSLGAFANASVATFFATTRSFVMCNLGNPPPLVYRQSDRSWDVMHGESNHDTSFNASIAGIMPKAEYRRVRTDLNVGDMVVMYGNGVAQASLSNGKLVGHANMLNALRESPHSCPESRLNHLKHLIMQQGNPDEDMNFITWTVTSRSVRMLDNFLAPLRMFQRPRSQTQLV